MASAPGVTFAPVPLTVRSFAPPLIASHAPHSSTFTCASSWQITASVVQQIATIASAFAAVPVGTNQTGASASNVRRTASSASRVHRSAP